jgi:hypothetical protein
MKVSGGYCSNIIKTSTTGGMTMAEEPGKKYGQLIAKAWSDEGFKARLLANPKAAMAEVGMDAPEGVEIEVVESTQEKAYLVISPKPVGELSDEDLDKVSGGYCSLPPGPCHSTCLLHS